MQLIIDIPEEEYKCVQLTGHIGNATQISNAIFNGTPLDSVKAEILQLDYDIDFVDYDYNDMPMTDEIHTICREEVLQILDNIRKAEGEK